jgi:hypothetical protein
MSARPHLPRIPGRKLATWEPLRTREQQITAQGGRAIKSITVLVVGPPVTVHGFQTHLSGPGDCVAAIYQYRPDVIISIGAEPDALRGLPLELRKRWIHFDETPPAEILAQAATATYGANMAGDRFVETPLMTVFTPLYATTGAQLERAYRSLTAQHFDNWEWVLFDDSPRPIHDIIPPDPRIRYYRSDRHSGHIGEVKHNAAMLGHGKVLVELDHDDELTPTALADIVAVWADKPGCMYYSDCAEIGPDGQNLTYPDGWGFGYGSYRYEQGLAVTNYPPVNATTLSHITGVPNHVRAWDAGLYHRIGGHNPALVVADDYELILRSYLASELIHIPQLCYIQHCGGHTTQRRINADIQELCRWIWANYRSAVLKRCEQR